MPSSTYVDKAVIVATPRSGGPDTGADREPPELVGTSRNAVLLRTLGIEAAGNPR